MSIQRTLARAAVKWPIQACRRRARDHSSGSPIPDEPQTYPGEGVGDRLIGMEYVPSSTSFLLISFFDRVLSSCRLAFLLSHRFVNSVPSLCSSLCSFPRSYYHYLFRPRGWHSSHLIPHSTGASPTPRMSRFVVHSTFCVLPPLSDLSDGASVFGPSVSRITCHHK